MSMKRCDCGDYCLACHFGIVESADSQDFSGVRRRRYHVLPLGPVIPRRSSSSGDSELKRMILRQPDDDSIT